ncbi:hypothetical protein CCR95_21310 [Thiocystis minor]|uniref:glycosyltransferase n=1 Tax=Thiocystis minor TaxID=61597 RepID=UPI001912C59F|nr:glycosyltransferase [Thiocystis minor]MBK5966542.1 hypothetical protein [Thiocystis minor]
MNAGQKKRTKVCYVLSYRDPNYIRTQSILNALQESEIFDVDVVINHHCGFLRYFDTIWKLLIIKRQRAPDVFIIGFRGHEIYWPVRWIAGERKIIFDALMSPYAALYEEKKFGLLGVMMSRIWRGLEASILEDADVILTDTYLHERYYQKEFAIQPDKLFSIPVGATAIVSSRPFPPRSGASNFSVLFYGSFLPLHGVQIIIDAASSLTDLPIRFDFIGGSSSQARRLHERCSTRGIKNYTYRDWLPYERLLTEVIPNASVCLGGPFGNTRQARRVITGKTSQCLALGKVTIIGRIALANGFLDYQNCLLVNQGNPEALADKIRWCYDNQNRLADIGEAGKAIYEKELSIPFIRDRLKMIIKNIEISA